MKKISILGTGCPKCKTLHSNVIQAVGDVNAEYEIEKIEDIVEIVGFGVMSTPALAIDGKVVAVGKVLSVKEIKKFL